MNAKGMLALCSRDRLGIITEDKPQKVNYEDGKTGLAYVGIHLDPLRLGQPWSSRNPRFLFHVRLLERTLARIFNF